MTDTTCVRCGRPMAEQAYADTDCMAKAADQLQRIIDMTPAARDVAHRQSTQAGGGSTSGKPGSRLPFDLGAAARLIAVQNELTTWARHVAAERGVPAWDGTESPDFLIRAAGYLAVHLEWVRHRPECDEFLTDVAACARVVAGIARGPAAQKYLGPCGAEISIGTLADPEKTYECDGDVYVRGTASNGRCRSCGAEVARREREAWLDGEVRSQAFRAAHIAQAYGVNVKTIRSWAARGLLLEHARDRDGWPLYLVADVLDLAAGDAARREEARAKRARREAVKAEDERLSA